MATRFGDLNLELRFGIQIGIQAWGLEMGSWDWDIRLLGIKF